MPVPSAHEVRVQTHLSGISPGTERLIYRGQAPMELPADATLSSMDGDTLEFPLSYGYACVGTVDEVGDNVSADWVGTRVFAFHPHTSAFTCVPDALVPLPEAVSDEAAALVPSLETAVTFVMDGRPTIGEAVVVFGQGVVGLLTTVLLAKHPLDTLVAVEPTAERRRWARQMGAHHTFSPDEMGAVREALGVQSLDAQEADEEFEGADLAYEVSGHAPALNDAVSCTGFSGRIVVGSWYGTEAVPLALGRRFHRSRIEFRSSQVSTIAPRDRGRWTKARRMRVVLSLLDAHAFEDLVTHSYSVGNAAQAYDDLDANPPSMLQPILRYH
jgi:2-desacetyl-2-hydroxyethyl bacteriochlorophyllide A dehydrogenase